MNGSKQAEKGFSSKEAERLLLQYGPNVLASKKKISAVGIFAGQFKDLMVLILLAATAVSALLGEAHEAIAIVVIVFINALLGFFQELRTEKTLEALAKMAAPGARVLRDGEVGWIEASQVVPGDLMMLEEGDRIAADGVVSECTALSCDESMLTGESEPIEKSPSAAKGLVEKVPHDAMVFMGTNVAGGRATVRVTATGMTTEMGAIAGMLDEIQEEETPLQQRLDQVGRVIGVGCLVICSIVALTGILRGEDPFNMLITGISLAVAAVPEGLPAIVTISLALAVRRILKRNALIKKLHAVETLGCATVICSDKTGTLTENRMTVRRLVTPVEALSLEEIRGEYPAETLRALESSPSLRMAAQTACWCNNARLSRKRHGILNTAERVVQGEPTEAALLLAADRLGIGSSSFTRTSERPFDSTRKRMSVTGLCADGRERVFVKGAPELLLPLCTSVLTREGVRTLTAESRRRIAQQNEQLAADALRVLGLAYKEVRGSGEDPEKNLIFVGLVGLHDPPRKEAARAVADCRAAHIRPVMITGDHAVTARAIASQLDILRAEDRVLTGAELDLMDDTALQKACASASVFARVTPAHKLRIVRAMKACGEVVAMTGDGVNDAPALKEANIGVAMGRGGTDVTREAAQVILLDDNFATLVAAIEEGRVIYKNIRRFLRYLLSCNAGEVITMFGGMLMGMPVILTPIQLLLVNLVTDGLPAIALGLEPADGDVMRERPRASDESIFAGGLLGTILFRGMLIGVTTLGIFSLFAGAGCSLETARTGALATLIMTQLFHVFECRSERRGILELNPFSNPMLLLAVLVSVVVTTSAIYLPTVSGIFETTVLSHAQLLTVLCCSVAVPVISSIALTLTRCFHRAEGLYDVQKADPMIRVDQ